MLPASAGNVWVALGSTVVVFAGLALIIVNSSGWPKVKHTFFDPAEFRAYFATIGHAFVLNIKIFLVAEVLILILAMVLAVLRSLPGAGVLPDPGAGDRLHRSVPRHPHDPAGATCSDSGSRPCISPTSPSTRSTWARPRWW